MKSRVVQVQDNHAELRERLRALKRAKLSVGIHAEDAATASGFNAAAIASVHEFGSRTVPARPFIGPTIDQERATYTRLMSRIARVVVRQGVPARAALDRLGLKVVSDIRATIDSGIGPPLSEVTIARREARNNGEAQNNVFSGHTPLKDTTQHIYNRLRHVASNGGD